MKYIFQHLGLGDHLICNGMVRKIVENTTDFYIMIVKSGNEITVNGMYSDISHRLGFISMPEEQMQVYLRNRITGPDGLVLIGYIPWKLPNSSFEKNFYHQQNINFNEKWDSFYSPRNRQAEEDLFKKYDITGDYIFVHDDCRFSIDSARLPANIRIIRPDPVCTANNTIMDYSLLIERAKEVHCIESSFGFMTDLMRLNVFTVHRYARRLIPVEVPEYRHAKEILV